MEADLKNFSYLIKMNIGPKKINIIVKNSKKVPEIFLETMAKEKIQKYINESYLTQKHYKAQTNEQYLNRMLKESSFYIEDLNEIEIFDLQLQFTNDEKIINDEKSKTRNNKSKFNEKKIS